jgi:endoglucanase
MGILCIDQGTRRVGRWVYAAIAAVISIALPANARPADACDADGRVLPPDTRFFIRQPDQGAILQIEDLFRRGRPQEAALVAKLESVPQAVWLTGGTPDAVASLVQKTLIEASFERTVPVFVPYNIPGRDCGGYSAGGAETTADYEAWINAIVGAVRERRVVIVLEPDAIANLPSDCGYDSTGQLTADRFTQIGYAVSALETLPRANVYIDAGHSHWQSVGTIASRLVQAGLAQAQGFFLNVSSYQPTAATTEYGTWIGECISFANDPSDGGWRLGNYDYCASQYYPATADDYSTWSLSDDWYTSNLSAPPADPPHFVIDTSRNGNPHATNAPSDPIYPTEEPGQMTVYALPPYDQTAGTLSSLVSGNYCNLPGAGAGARPTVGTQSALVDALLWVKTAGESDGPCDSQGGARSWDYAVDSLPGWPTTLSAQATFDPLWGLYDPAAGVWFPPQALQLAQLADPPLSLFPL